MAKAYSIYDSGNIKRMTDFIISEQLTDEELWELFANQFSEHTDVADLGWRGEYWGKTMRGACLIYKATRDAKLYGVLEKSVERLLCAQDADGRISTYDKKNEFKGWDVWCRKYVAIGLEYFFDICKDEALKKLIINALKKHCDYMIEHIGADGENKISITETSEIWGGMNSSSLLKPYVVLFGITKDEKYLDFARYILEEGGSKGFDIFEAAYNRELMPYEYPYKKAYEMIACFDGALEYYKATGEKKYLTSCERFAEAVFATDFTAVGGLSCYHEVFNHATQMQTVPINMIMQETCITVAMMLYSAKLFCITKNSLLPDRIETMFYNLYGGTLNFDMTRENGKLPFDSYSPIAGGSRGRAVGGKKNISETRFYGCCASMGAAGLGVFLDNAVSCDGGLFINHYLSSEIRYTTDLQKISIEQRTNYPESGLVELCLHMEKSEKFALWLRIPNWCEKVSVSSNAFIESYERREGYIVIDTVWKDGDEVRLELDMPFEISTAKSPSSQNICFCVKKGPVVFTADKRYCDLYEIYDGDPKTYVFREAGANADGVRTVEMYDSSKKKAVLIPYADAGKTYDERSAVNCWLGSNIKREETSFR